MVLRLVLVGLVAGLGLSLPSQRDLDTMARTAQHWINDRLAEWDTQTLSDQGAYVFVADPAETSRTWTVPAPAPAPTPAIVSDEEFAGVLEASVTQFAHDSLAATTRAMAQFVESPDQVAVVGMPSSLAIDLPTEPAAIPGVEASLPDLTEIAFEGWADETNPSHPVEMTAMNLSDPRDLAFEGVIEATVIGFERDASTLAAAERTVRDEPFEINEDLYTGEAYALNRISDGIQEPASAPREVGRTSNRLTDAVRLTREAVVAWASLLHGPAVVTIAR